MSVTTEVLVAPLRADERRRALLARLDQLPERLRVVLSGCYLEGRESDDVAADCRLTPAELAQLRADALRALGRSRAARTPRRPVASLYR